MGQEAPGDYLAGIGSRIVEAFVFGDGAIVPLEGSAGALKQVGHGPESRNLQQGVHNGGMGTCAAQMLHQMAEVLAGRGGPELLKGARKLDGLGDVSWQRLAGGGGGDGDGMEARGLCHGFLLDTEQRTYVEIFLTTSRKLSSAAMSGRSGPKRTRRLLPKGEGVRSPASACGNGRDLTRTGGIPAAERSSELRFFFSFRL